MKSNKVLGWRFDFEARRREGRDELKRGGEDEPS